MKILVVFDQTGQAEQNLRAAMQMARVTQISIGVETELLVCVLELMREDKALDDYLGEMERSTEQALMKIEHILDEAGDNLRPNVSVKVLRGIDLEITDLVAYQARAWQADLIQLSVGEECAICKLQFRERKLPPFFKLFHKVNKRKVTAQSLPPPEAYSPKQISLNDLLYKTQCRINVTCHGERLFTLYMHHSEVKSRQDRS